MAPGLQLHLTGPGICGCRIQRRSHVLACVFAPDIDAVMRQHLVVERADVIQLPRYVWLGLALAGLQIARDLSWQPWPALRRASNHHHVRTGLRQCLLSVFDRGDVAIGDDRNRNGILDLPDRRPVRASFVELAARAAMNRHELDAGVLCTPRELGRVPTPIIPAETHLQGYR